MSIFYLRHATFTKYFSCLSPCSLVNYWRLVKYFVTTEKEERSASAMWIACEPFSNPTVKRMLTIAHGTFCMMDLGDATIRAFITGGGNFDVTEFFLRLNIVGVGRFTISLYGEAKRAIVIRKAESEAQFARREMTIVENYLSGLSLLSELYDDKDLVDFIDDFKIDLEENILKQLDQLKTLKDCMLFYEKFDFWGNNLKRQIEECGLKTN